MRNLIKKILKESEDNFDWVDYDLGLSPCEEFIYNKLMECELVGSKKRPGWTKYVGKSGKILFLDNIDTDTESPVLYADHNEIWLKCEKMGISFEEIQKICVRMLWEVHKRKVFRSSDITMHHQKLLYETHKRKV